MTASKHVRGKGFSFARQIELSINESNIDSIRKRFEAKYTKRGPDDCWEWFGAIVGGYGHIKIGGKLGSALIAPRISYILYVQNPIPQGLFVLHTCDFRACVNPKHLWLGTNEDNMKDMVRKGRAKHTLRFGFDNWNTRLTEDDVRQIRSLHNNQGLSYHLIQHLHYPNLNRSYIGQICRRERRASVS